MRRHASLLLTLAAGACAAAPSPDADADVTADVTAAEAPRKEPIYPNGNRPRAPYSPGIRTGDLVFLSGQIGSVPGQGLPEGGIQPETRQALENVRAVLAAAGLAPEDVVKCTVFMVDIQDYGPMNEVYGEFFGETPPARSAFAVNALPAGARVEIECIAAART